jgi:hypothetical protein
MLYLPRPKYSDRDVARADLFARRDSWRRRMKTDLAFRATVFRILREAREAGRIPLIVIHERKRP